MDKSADDQLTLADAEVFGVDGTDVHKDDTLNVLSEEQTNEALAALEGHVDVVDTEPTLPHKRKTSEDDDGPPRQKQRRAPTRVPWEDRVEMLKAYKEIHGNLLIPIRFKENPSLGKFVHNTREQYKLFHKQTPDGYKKKCSLTAERIQQLDEIGFVWSTNRTGRQDEDWNRRFTQLQEYKELNGDCLVPHGYTQDPSFAEWIHRQRTTHAALKKSKKENQMVKERMEKLESIGFNFTVHSDKWMDHFKQLKEYKEKHGDCQVPTHYADNLRLGRWVHTQRHQHRLKTKDKKTCMNEERLQLLNDIGFSWEVKPGLDRPRATWQQRFDEFRSFYSKTGNFFVSAATDPLLYAWVYEQKNRLRNLEKNKGKDFSKRMGPERVEMLSSIGFTATTELSKRTAEFGDANVPDTVTDNVDFEPVHIGKEDQIDSAQHAGV